MSKKRKDEDERLSGMSFDEALARLIQTNPDELTEQMAADVLRGRERAKKRIQAARKEIDDGARPRKGRFRL